MLHRLLITQYAIVLRWFIPVAEFKNTERVGVIACGVVKSITSDRQAHKRAAIFARRASRPENDIAMPLTQRLAIECRR